MYYWVTNSLFVASHEILYEDDEDEDVLAFGETSITNMSISDDGNEPETSDQRLWDEQRSTSHSVKFLLKFVQDKTGMGELWPVENSGAHFPWCQRCSYVAADAVLQKYQIWLLPRKKSSTLLSAFWRKLSELVTKESSKHFLELSTKPGTIHRWNIMAAISKRPEKFAGVRGSHGWVNYLTIIYFVVRTDGGYLSMHEIIILRNQKNEGAKARRQDLNFIKKLQKVLQYFWSF